MPSSIVWCDIPVLDLDRAIHFYSCILGEPVTKQVFGETSIGLFPDADTAASGCLYQSPDDKPSAIGPLVYLNCSGRLEEALSQVELSGGKVLQPKHAIGSHGSRAIIMDSEGNRIALHSS